VERHEPETSAEVVDLETGEAFMAADSDDGQGGTERARPSDEDSQHLRMLEALLFAADEPLDEQTLQDRLPDGVDVKGLLESLSREYENRGVHLVCVADRWTLRTAPDLNYLMERERKETRRLSRAAIETLAIIAYHQPVTRAEIEEVRGVSVSRGTIDLLMELGWVRLRGRRKVPGRPVTYGTTDEFLSHFGLENVQNLPGLEELKAAGLLDARLPPGFSVPSPQPSTEEEEAELDEPDEESGQTEFHTDFLAEDGEED
jgi:segregation and condensation protein B